MSYKTYFGKTFSEEAEKVIGYLVAKNILGFLCAHENDTFDNLFPPGVDNHICCFTEDIGHLSSKQNISLQCRRDSSSCVC